MLHGTGSDEREIATLAERLDQTAATLAPRGRVNENGALRWFRRLSEGVFDVDDVIARAGQLADFLGWARSEYGLERRPLVAVGFSNGANMALALAILHPDVVTRVIAFSGMYPLGERELPRDLPAISVLLLNGDSDPMAPAPSVDRLVAQLTTRGAAVERITRPGGHGITAEELETARRWLSA
jgi:phospholipase/carboxylesterase